MRPFPVQGTGGHRKAPRLTVGELGNRLERGGKYDWFTEGFDTADLKEAKALLDELA